MYRDNYSHRLPLEFNMKQDRTMQRPGRRYQFESLETRCLMAGNVKAAVTQGVMQLTGDNSSNLVQVRQISGGKWEVQGIGTTVNGKSSFTAKDVHQIIADLREGHDFFKIGGNLGFTLTVNGHGGNDVVQLVNFTSLGTSVVTGNGSDSVLASNVRATDTLRGLTVETEGGNDAVTLDRITAGAVGVSTGDGNDVVVAMRTTIRSDEPEFSGFSVSAGNGTDTVSLSGVDSQERIFVDMGEGKFDALAAINSRTNNATFLGGDDTGDTLVRSLNQFKKQSVSGFKFVV